MKIYVIHENNEWTDHLVKRLKEINAPYEMWHLHEGTVDLSEVPPQGVFYNRMSASSHTRGNRFAPELTNIVLRWLEFHGRTVINGTLALSLEINKTAQYMSLEAHGIKTPYTIATVGKEQLIKASKKFNNNQFITKHNRAGKGLGVMLFNKTQDLENYINSKNFEEPIDGITLLQQYIKPLHPYIIRSEFIGAKYLYSVRVDTSQGFELCPADACQIGDLFCPVGEDPKDQMKFKIVENPHTSLIEKYESFLKANEIGIAGIEFIQGEDNSIYTYDINTNTNYNSEAEAKAEKYGMLEIAKYLKGLL